ncbi:MULTISPECIES: DUF6920 family protein [Haloferax]|uniref:DUF6920 family protein n=1 Tax=Haloferax TaxID=2251 RepID=UPI001CD9FF38|nr:MULTISPECIES: DUF6544 family protein [Haloferax]
MSTRLVERLEADAVPESNQTDTVTADDFEGLPAPVQRYLDHVITDGRPYVRTARLHQTGAFRLGDSTAPWKPLEATQQYTVGPPGFVWDARIEFLPHVPIRVVDAYVDGTGVLTAKLFSLIPLANAESTRELDEGELARHLAEMVWFPTAFLPGQGVEWEALDAHSARATLTHRETSASVVFHFDENDEITRVTAERWYETDDGSYELHPWTGYFFDYHDVDGLRIPGAGEVEWNLPDGDRPYWRAAIDDIEYTP